MKSVGNSSLDIQKGVASLKSLFLKIGCLRIFIIKNVTSATHLKNWAKKSWYILFYFRYWSFLQDTSNMVNFLIIPSYYSIPENTKRTHMKKQLL